MLCFIRGNIARVQRRGTIVGVCGHGFLLAAGVTVFDHPVVFRVPKVFRFQLGAAKGDYKGVFHTGLTSGLLALVPSGSGFPVHRCEALVRRLF